MNEQTINSVHVKTLYDTRYFRAPVSDVWGGLTVNGDTLEIYFVFNERALPEAVDRILADGIWKETRREPEKDRIIARVLFSTVVSINSAEAIAKWMLEKIAVYRQSTSPLASLPLTTERPQ